MGENPEGNLRRALRLKSIIIYHAIIILHVLSSVAPTQQQQQQHHHHHHHQQQPHQLQQSMHGGHHHANSQQLHFLDKKAARLIRELNQLRPPLCTSLEECGDARELVEVEIHSVNRARAHERARLGSSRGGRKSVVGNLSTTEIAFYLTSNARLNGANAGGSSSPSGRSYLYDIWDRCGEAWDAWGRLFPHFWCVASDAQATRGLARLCTPMSTSSSNSSSSSYSLFAGREHNCSRAELPNLLLSPCGSKYSSKEGGAPCCGMNFALKHALRASSPPATFTSAAASSSPIKWAVFCDDDQFFYPPGLLHLLAPLDPTKRQAVVATGGLTAGVFGNHLFSCEGVVRHMWVQPLILSAAAVSSMRVAIAANAIVEACLSWDLFQDVVG